MQRIRRFPIGISLAAVLLSLSGLFPRVCYAGPFGLDAGMSRAEVIQRIGKSSIVQEYSNTIAFNSVPTRSDYFDTYNCSFDQNGRLWVISAFSKILATKSEGEDLRSSFDDLKSALEDKYGKALYVTGSKASESRWIDSGRTVDPYVEAVWDGSGDYGKSAHIDQIDLTIQASDNGHGYIRLIYRFNTRIEDPL
jgi:hypothetical protein